MFVCPFQNKKIMNHSSIVFNKSENPSLLLEVRIYVSSKVLFIFDLYHTVASQLLIYNTKFRIIKQMVSFVCGAPWRNYGN